MTCKFEVNGSRPEYFGFPDGISASIVLSREDVRFGRLRRYATDRHVWWDTTSQRTIVHIDDYRGEALLRSRTKELGRENQSVRITFANNRMRVVHTAPHTTDPNPPLPVFY